MARLKFGAFLAPHHPIGEHPSLQFRRDIELATHLDDLGFDEFWVGEHHSTGWEVIASPELFLAAVAEKTRRIKLGTGVVSLPYHHPFNVAQRIVQLDHMTQGRVLFGTGPGALASDALMLGIDPVAQRDRQDESLGVILRLLAGERFTHESDWFVLRDAALQLLPLQENMEVTVASHISPSGMTLAGKYGLGVLSIGSNSTQGLSALQTQWSFAEDSAANHGKTVDRSNWRVTSSWHIAETREKAREQAKHGLMRWNNEYMVMRAGVKPFSSPDEAVDMVAHSETAAAVIGTPDDLVAGIKKTLAISGGFGTILGMVNDWANPEDQKRSWDLVARYVIPELNGLCDPYRASMKYLVDNRPGKERAAEAVMQKIMSNDLAVAALKSKSKVSSALPSPNAPDLNKESDPI